MSTDTTRVRLLDAAEQLLAASSYEDLRIRAVCTRAQLNPAAVHYHFGSKEQLVTALLEDRLGPVWADPLNALSRRNTSVREIVDAIVDPLIPLLADPELSPHLHLLGRFVLTHPESEWTATWFRIDVWAALLTRVVDVDGRTARRRWRFAFTVLMTELASPVPLTPKTATALRDFLSAGLAAPATPDVPADSAP